MTVSVLPSLMSRLEVVNQLADGLIIRLAWQFFDQLAIKLSLSRSGCKVP